MYNIFFSYTQLCYIKIDNIYAIIVSLHLWFLFLRILHQIQNRLREEHSLQDVLFKSALKGYFSDPVPQYIFLNNYYYNIYYNMYCDY